MKIGTDQYNTFDTMTMDCWNDRVYYEGKEFPAGQFAAEILNFAGEIHDPLLERITVLTALVDDLSTAEKSKRHDIAAQLKPMLEHAERIADGYRRLQYEMDLFTDRLGGELKVGASTTIAQYVLPQVLARFTARFPEVKVSLASGNSEQVEAALARHDTDLGLVESSARHPGFHYEPFIPDELVLIASTKGRYGRCDQVTLAELQTVPLVLRESGSGTLEVISKYLAAADVRLASLRVVMQLGSTESIKSFVRNSDAMAIVSVASIVDELRSGELRIIDIEGCTIRREFSFCWPEGRSDALAARFVEFARHTA